MQVFMFRIFLDLFLTFYAVVIEVLKATFTLKHPFIIIPYRRVDIQVGLYSINLDATQVTNLWHTCIEKIKWDNRTQF